MKKNLLIAALVVPLLSVSAQWTQTGGTVTVKPNTLKYVQGNFEVKANATETNQGNVKVDGSFTVDDANAGVFKNDFASGTQYGQLILKNGQTVTGKIVSGFKNATSAVFPFHPLGIPFTNYKASDLAEQLGITTPVYNAYTGNGSFQHNRYLNTIWKWNNSQYALENLDATTTTTVLPTGEYIVFNQMTPLTNEGSVVDYKGTPNATEVQLDLSEFNIPGSDNLAVNMYGEELWSYLDDPFVTVDAAWSTQTTTARPADYGENLYYFSNPYTSNINLTDIIPSDGKVKGIQQVPGTSYDESGQTSGATLNQDQMVTYTSGNGFGDSEILQVRPFHTFVLKVDRTQTPPANFTLADGVKTFDITGATPPPSYNRNAVHNPFYQLKMMLNIDGSNIYQTFIGAAQGFEAAEQGGNEAYNIRLDDNADAIYTLQENADGSINQELMGNKTYINGINVDNYVAKPIHLVHQVATPGQYTFKGIVSEDVLNSSNEFYFEDVEEGFIQNITADFEYSFTATETSTDRFRIYWNGTPETMSVGDVASKAKTLVYKNNDDNFKVRFADHWTRANVMVYNVMGQLVHVAKDVDASYDYTLPLKGQSAAYIVKAVNADGEVATQKIIKK